MTKENDTDENGWNISRALEYIKDEDLMEDFIDDLPNWKIKTKCFTEGFHNLIKNEDEDLIKTLKAFCLYGIDFWQEWMEKKGYEVDV